MRIDIITVLPEMIEGFFNCSIMARAQKKGLAEIKIHNLRDYTLDKHKRVDDYPYGGCAGMVMQIEPIDRCISSLKSERDYDEVIFTMTIGEEGIIYSEVVTQEKTDYGYRVTVTTEKGTNIFEVNVGERTVSVESADCEGGDCWHMKISKKSDSIVCLPHLLRVECTDGIDRPVSG